jgi:hypothetical protein
MKTKKKFKSGAGKVSIDIKNGDFLMTVKSGRRNVRMRLDYDKFNTLINGFKSINPEELYQQYIDECVRGHEQKKTTVMKKASCFIGIYNPTQVQGLIIDDREILDESQI